jgi:predicted short-subunit dehydrogenase-like oxidoreductase (DUF2520 family)
LRDATPSVGFIGAGRVGGALATSLSESGYAIPGIASRSIESAQALASKLPASRALLPQQVADSCDLVFLTIPDGAIRGVCDGIAWRSGAGVVHTSGALSRLSLESAARQGAFTGSLHPLQTFADHAQARLNLPGSVFAVEAEPPLRRILLDMVERLRGTPVELSSEEKALYHASAVLASNYTVTLMKMASDLWLRFGWERPAAVRALVPLLKGAVNNIEALGVPLALTGPIARGDVETVERNIEALKDAAPEITGAYIELARQTVPIALARGGLDGATATQLTSILEREEASKSGDGAPSGKKGNSRA